MIDSLKVFPRRQSTCYQEKRWSIFLVDCSKLPRLAPKPAPVMMTFRCNEVTDSEQSEEKWTMNRKPTSCSTPSRSSARDNVHLKGSFSGDVQLKPKVVIPCTRKTAQQTLLKALSIKSNGREVNWCTRANPRKELLNGVVLGEVFLKTADSKLQHSSIAVILLRTTLPSLPPTSHRIFTYLPSSYGPLLFSLQPCLFSASTLIRPVFSMSSVYF